MAFDKLIAGLDENHVLTRRREEPAGQLLSISRAGFLVHKAFLGGLRRLDQMKRGVFEAGAEFGYSSRYT